MSPLDLQTCYLATQLEMGQRFMRCNVVPRLLWISGFVWRLTLWGFFFCGKPWWVLLGCWSFALECGHTYLKYAYQDCADMTKNSIHLNPVERIWKTWNMLWMKNSYNSCIFMRFHALWAPWLFCYPLLSWKVKNFFWCAASRAVCGNCPVEWLRRTPGDSTGHSSDAREDAQRMYDFINQTRTSCSNDTWKSVGLGLHIAPTSQSHWSLMKSHEFMDFRASCLRLWSGERLWSLPQHAARIVGLSISPFWY